MVEKGLINLGRYELVCEGDLGLAYTWPHFSV